MLKDRVYAPSFVSVSNDRIFHRLGNMANEVCRLALLVQEQTLGRTTFIMLALTESEILLGTTYPAF
jgi:hypothetical protein